MKVESLSIERRSSYDADYPSQLVGMVHLKGPAGEQKVRLSNGALARIFQVVSLEVQGTASRNASDVQRGMEDAMNEPLMLAESSVELLS